MESLFNTNIAGVEYHVVFDHEKYIFTPSGSGSAHTGFSFEREHDEWHTNDSLTEELKQQATEALDRYLLKQH